MGFEPTYGLTHNSISSRARYGRTSLPLRVFKQDRFRRSGLGRQNLYVFLRWLASINEAIYVGIIKIYIECRIDAACRGKDVL